MSVKKKVVHVLSVFPSKSETFVVNLVLESLRHDFSAQIMAGIIADIDNSSQGDLINKNSLYPHAKTYNTKIPPEKYKRVVKALFLLLRNLKHFKVFIRTLNSKKYGLKSKSLKMWFQAGEFLQHRDAEVFHGHFGINGLLLAQMKEIGAIRGRLIVSYYGYDTFSTANDRDYVKEQNQLTFNLAECIFVSSNYLKKNLLMLNAPEDKIKVNCVGVNTALFSYKVRTTSDIFKIITVGRLIALKGQDLGLKVIEILKSRGCNIQYTIVGDGEEMESLKRKAKVYSITDKVIFLGSAMQAEIIELLHSHHLFLMTSITDNTGRAEGQGLVTAEAQSTGMPVVGFNSGGISETISDSKTGFLVDEKDVIAMADKVEFLIKNRNIYDKLSKSARAFIEQNFNNQKQSNNILEHYSYE